MFADDTQLLSKNEESVEQSFLILSRFEKACGSKINYEKTKGLFIGTLMTFGKQIINKMKSSPLRFGKPEV